MKTRLCIGLHPEECPPLTYYTPDSRQGVGPGGSAFLPVLAPRGTSVELGVVIVIYDDFVSSNTLNGIDALLMRVRVKLVAVDLFSGRPWLALSMASDGKICALYSHSIS